MTDFRHQQRLSFLRGTLLCSAVALSAVACFQSATAATSSVVKIAHNIAQHDLRGSGGTLHAASPIEIRQGSEPASLVLLGTGALGLTSFGIRRSRLLADRTPYCRSPGHPVLLLLHRHGEGGGGGDRGRDGVCRGEGGGVGDGRGCRRGTDRSTATATTAAAAARESECSDDEEQREERCCSAPGRGE